MANNIAGPGDHDSYYYDDGYDDGEQPDHEEWVSLGFGVWLILHTFPDGDAVTMWAIDQPGSGRRIGGL